MARRDQLFARQSLRLMPLLGTHVAPTIVMVLALVGGWISSATSEPKAYVTNEKSNDISVIDTAMDKVVATMPVGERPRGIHLSPDGKRVYVALGDEDRIAVVDTTSLQVIERISAGSDPELFDISPDGKRLFVSNEDANTASVIDLQTRQIVASVPVGIEPEGVTVSPDGRLV
jgi:YVTN family beta-propeller protein